MKHLLLILSLLLLSSPVIGQETSVSYHWENGTKYMGEWKDGKNMVKEHLFMEKGNGKETSMKGNSRLDIEMVKEHTPGLMETSMQGSLKMINQMVKEHTLGLMEESMKGNSRKG